MKLWLVIVLVVALLLPALSAQAADPVKYTVILNAYSYQADDGTWLGESGPYFNAMTDRQPVTDLPWCGTAFTGKLYGQDVLVITMGTAKLETSECAMSLIFSPYLPQIKELIWSGIAGFSPRVGAYASNNPQTVVGDVCIADRVGNWDLTFSSMVTQQFWPMTWPNRADKAIGDTELADELYAAAQKVEWPPLPAGPQANVAKYFPGWEQRLPKAWYGMCAEVTSDNFWHSSIDDRFAREQVAALFGLASERVLAVTAMEVLSWMNAFEDYEAISGVHIPMAYVRSSSNFDMPWVLPDGKDAVSPAQSISEGMETGGSDFGCVTAALPVLKLLQLRSQ